MMSGNDCWNGNVFSCWRKVAIDGDDWTWRDSVPDSCGSNGKWATAMVVRRYDGTNSSSVDEDLPQVPLQPEIQLWGSAVSFPAGKGGARPSNGFSYVNASRLEDHSQQGLINDENHPGGSRGSSSKQIRMASEYGPMHPIGCGLN